jgi:hypothetical protein
MPSAAAQHSRSSHTWHCRRAQQLLAGKHNTAVELAEEEGQAQARSRRKEAHIPGAAAPRRAMAARRHGPPTAAPSRAWPDVAEQGRSSTATAPGTPMNGGRSQIRAAKAQTRWRRVEEDTSVRSTRTTMSAVERRSRSAPDRRR